jgi:phosphocarrier protein HPr
MKQQEVLVKWRAGLHARPAGDIVKLANKFKSKVTIKKDHIEVDGKSIFGIMMLGATYKTVLCVVVDGEDEDDAVAALVNLFENNINE